MKKPERNIVDMLEKTDVQAESTVIVADGAYAGEANTELAKSKNIRLITTDLPENRSEERIYNVRCRVKNINYTLAYATE